MSRCKTAGRCMAPTGEVDEAGEELLCGHEAHEERDVDGLVFLLCDEHAAELDAEKSN